MKHLERINDINVDIHLEEGFSFQGKKRIVDLVIRVFDKAPTFNREEEVREIHRIVIENKIKSRKVKILFGVKAICYQLFI